MVKEYSVKAFKRVYGPLWALVPVEIRRDAETDSKYIVRIDLTTHIFELGYPSDEWGLK